ncbi:class I SAM-dependent DNA methyltransferase [Parasedimentitalea psychrophila]|uniref:Class I SAM-dependent methyltransferase n=1 Tax=Parasedimentitalea psychrophila TaxID=2997337 RepID=A0A9Y2KY29_9RHOB|nr:class I SAM-dependent methyltransferase [Parasedimentitalea psychrophila]WIY24793.1 class I SAM-dependent methyltransferase [Parasedimentitalea psychrophila]
MTDDWNDYADGWDDNSDVKLYATQAFAALDAHVDMRGKNWQSSRILDFGCGTGLLTEKIAPHVMEVIAVDTSDKMIAILKEKNLCNVRAVHGDVLTGDIRDVGDWFSDFDLICASSVCGFLPDYSGAVTALAGLLRRGGQFVQWDWQSSGNDGFGLTEPQMRESLKAAHLSSIRVEQVFEIEADAQAMPVLMGVGVRHTD